MVQLNSKGEVADFVNEPQFEGGESAYECVAFCAALIKYAGAPGKGPTGTGEQVDQLADFWYGKAEGDYSASNTNGMSLDAEYMMLRGLNMPFKALAPTVAAIKIALEEGYPVMLCGAETGMHDLDLGDTVPYGWSPVGNHCIVASGIASDGNLLVRDTASIAPTGVRPGPRRYDAAKLQIVSATAIIVPWEIDMTIAYNTPGVKPFFTETDPTHWLCLQTGKIIRDAILDAYKKYGNKYLCGLTYAGLPKGNEIPIENIKPPDNPTKYAHLAGKGITVQPFECLDLVYDPQHLLDKRPGMDESVYPAHVNDGLGADLLAAIQPKAPTVTGIDPVKVKDRLTAIGLASHNNDTAIQSLVNQAIV